MARGRPRKPAEKRTGHRAETGKGKVVDLVPTAPALAQHDPPVDLPADAAIAWRLAIADMAGNKALAESDLVQLKCWCEAVHVHEEASAGIHAHGLLVKGPRGTMVNPLIRIQKEAAATIRQIGAELGLSPMARIRGNLMAVASQSMALDVRDRLLKILAEQDG